jgi:hypothetical protein
MARMYGLLGKIFSIESAQLVSGSQGVGYTDAIRKHRHPEALI